MGEYKKNEVEMSLSSITFRKHLAHWVESRFHETLFYRKSKISSLHPKTIYYLVTCSTCRLDSHSQEIDGEEICESHKSKMDIHYLRNRRMKF